MTLCWRTGMLAFIVVLGVSVAAFAEEPSPGTMKQDHQMGGMQQRGMSGMGMGMGMMKQDKQMGGMQDCKMMGEMKNQQQLMREMKKHMRMMDEMMEMMMQPQQGMTPSGSESEPQEHHPSESK